jgi:hypothetical protein
VHDIGVVWHACDQPGCTYKAKHGSHLKQHKANVHGIGVVWHTCDQPGCTYKAKMAGSIKQHKALVHGIGVVWHTCDHPGCTFRTKQAFHIKQHKADVHDIGVVWHTCDQPGCTFRAKQASHLSVHMKCMHNDTYIARKKQQEERVRLALLGAGYAECFATANMPRVGQFKREKRIDFKCASVQSATQYARIDFVVATRGGLVFLEVDEGQHLYGYDASVSCDMKRMSHVMETLSVELGNALPYVYWLRYNPNAYHVNGELVSVPKAEREARLVRWLMEFEAVAPLQIGYAFYDSENDRLNVLANENYNAVFAEVAEDLGQLGSEARAPTRAA